MTSASLTNESLLCAPPGRCSMQISTECLSNRIVTYYIFSLLIFQEIKYHQYFIGRILVYLSCISIWIEKHLSTTDRVWGRCPGSLCSGNWEVLLKNLLLQGREVGTWAWSNVYICLCHQMKGVTLKRSSV